jgi:hypothetical protein
MVGRFAAAQVLPTIALLSQLSLRRYNFVMERAAPRGRAGRSASVELDRPGIRPRCFCEMSFYKRFVKKKIIRMQFFAKSAV